MNGKLQIGSCVAVPCPALQPKIVCLVLDAVADHAMNVQFYM